MANVSGSERKRRKKTREENSVCARCSITLSDGCADTHHDFGRGDKRYTDEAHRHAVCKPCHRGIHQVFPQQAVPLSEVLAKEASGEIKIARICCANCA